MRGWQVGVMARVVCPLAGVRGPTSRNSFCPARPSNLAAHALPSLPPAAAHYLLPSLQPRAERVASLVLIGNASHRIRAVGLTLGLHPI